MELVIRETLLMKNALSASVRRSNAHAMWVECALETLDNPAVADALDAEQFNRAALHQTLSNSFVVQRQYGRMIIPSDQVATNNFPIYPILNTDICRPIRGGPEWLRPNDLLYLRAHRPDLLALWTMDYPDRQTMLDAVNKPTTQWHFDYIFDGENDAVPVAKRALMHTPTAGLSVWPAVLTAATMCHEAEHFNNMNDLLCPMPAAEARVWFTANGRLGKSTESERTAYALSHIIFVATGVELPISVDEMTNMFTGLQPIEAGSKLLDITVALTRLFGDDTSTATAAEIAAYAAANLLSDV